MNILINNNQFLLFYNSSFYVENLFIEENKEKYNIFNINSLDFLNNNIKINQFIQNNSLFNKNEKILMITDINMIPNNKINIIIKKIKQFNKKIVLFGNGNSLNKIKKINIKIKTIDASTLNKKNYYKSNFDKINNNDNNNNKDLYKICKKIMFSNEDINIKYNLYSSEKVYIPLLIHYNINNYIKNDKIIYEYLQLFSISETIQMNVFKQQNEYIKYLYFILTCYIPHLFIKKYGKKTDDIFKFTNIISFQSLMIINKNKYYKYLNASDLDIMNTDIIKKIIKDCKNDHKNIELYSNKYNLDKKWIKNNL